MVCKIAADYKLSLGHLEPNTVVYAHEKSRVHKRSAERLLKLACDNGGVYIKVGQHLGSLSYLLPVEYVSILSVLHSKAPVSSFKDVCRVIEEDFGKKVIIFFISTRYLIEWASDRRNA
ncbi:unnamed protein product [Soboliphyme baturini]|uniref:DUF2179 domain-containing protein n=1 Tax=Soboliphyme baturini TaxID=241478 RepID=A0A183JA68_9BILA|nr:unnamed protein product [Soboliphyme baturini]